MQKLLPVLVLAAWVAPAAAQNTVRLSAGAIYSTHLLKDLVVPGNGVTTLKAGIAPTVSLAFTHPTGNGYRVMVEAEYGTSTLQVDDSISHNGSLGSLATLGLVGMLDAPFHWGIRLQLGGGALWYRPSEHQGVFLDGGTRRWLFAVGASYVHPLTKTLGLLATARYQLHNFTTSTLMAHGFQGSQSIHRVGLFAGLERTF